MRVRGGIFWCRYRLSGGFGKKVSCWEVDFILGRRWGWAGNTLDWDVTYLRESWLLGRILIWG